MNTRPLASAAVAMIMGAAVVAIAQSASPPEFKPLPKLLSTAPAQASPPRVVSLNRPAEAAFTPLPQIEPADPSGERSTATIAKMRAAYQQLWQAMTYSVFQSQFQQTLTLIKIANQQPSVRAKVEAARKEVQDYIRQHSPEMMPVFEKMNAPRELQRQEGQLTELVF